MTRPAAPTQGRDMASRLCGPFYSTMKRCFLTPGMGLAQLRASTSGFARMPPRSMATGLARWVAEAVVFATGTARRGRRLAALGTRQLAREEFLPARVIRVARDELRIVAREDRRDIGTSVESKIAPQVIGAQTRRADDRREA